MGCNAKKFQIQTAEGCGLFSSLFLWAGRLFANCSNLPQRIATIVWHNKGALRENGTDLPHNLRKVLPAKAHAGTFSCGCGRSSGAQQAHKKLSPVSMRGNSQNGGQTTKSLLTKPQCSGVPIQQAVSLSSSFPRHCLLFVCAFFRETQAVSRSECCPAARSPSYKNRPGFLLRKPGRFVCFICAFSSAHDFSGSSARSICKGFLFAESLPIGIFYQTGIGTLNNFPRIVVRKAHHFQNTLAVHPVFRKDTLLGPNNHIHQWNFAFISDEKIQWQIILQNALICAKILSIFAQVGDFLFTLKALLLCAVPLFRSSSSDLAADYNVSLCGQRCSAQRFLLSSMIFFFIIRHQNPNEKHHRHPAQNPRIKFYAKKPAKIGFLRSFCRSSPNFATDLLQTTEKGASYTFHYQYAKVNPLHFCISEST